MDNNGNKPKTDPWTKSFRSFTRNSENKAAIGRNYVWIWDYLRNESYDKTWTVRGKIKDFAEATDEKARTVRRALDKWEKNKLIKKKRKGAGYGLEIKFIVHLEEKRDRPPVDTLLDGNNERDRPPVDTLSKEIGHQWTPYCPSVDTLLKHGKSITPLIVYNYQPENGNNGTLKETIKNKVFKERDKKHALLAKITAKYCLASYLKEFPQQACAIDFDGKWVKDTGLMLKKDGWEPEQIRTYWKYARNHHYWSGPIGSPGALRKNIGGIERDYKREQNRKKNNADAFNSEKSSEAIEDDRIELKEHAEKAWESQDPHQIKETREWIDDFEIDHPESKKVLSPQFRTKFNDFLKGQKMMNGSKVK